MSKFYFIALGVFSITTTTEVDKFCISTLYTPRKEYNHFDDRIMKDECQKEVYWLAKDIATKLDYKAIVDIGCGSGYKLIKNFVSYKTIGYELEPTLSFLKDTYPDREWHLSDLKKEPPAKNVDLIICSDVIEHLVNPDVLLEFISQFNFKKLVLSTPDRSILVKEQNHPEFGPPRNPYHVREWTFEELENYINKWFRVEQHLIVNRGEACQVVVCTKH